MDPTPNDEIDLQELGVSIIRYFSRYFKFISIVSVMGVILGGLFYALVPPMYESQMIVNSDILTESYSDRLEETLGRLITERNDSILGNRLNIPPEKANGVKGIRINTIKKVTEGEKDEYNIIIGADVNNKSLFPMLQDGIVYCLRNNDYVKIRVSQRERMNRILIEKLDKEINSIDSLKVRLFQGKSVYSKSGEMMLVDPTNIYTQLIELNKLKLEYQDALELSNSIQVIEGFTPFTKPTSPKLFVALGVGFGLGFLGAIIILAIKKLLKLASNR